MSIIEVDDNPVDTSSIIVVYSVIKALEKVLGNNSKSLLVDFDNVNGLFLFSK